MKGSISTPRGLIGHVFRREYNNKTGAFEYERSISAYSQGYFVKHLGNFMAWEHKPRSTNIRLLLKELVNYIQGKSSEINFENCKK